MARKSPGSSQEITSEDYRFLLELAVAGELTPVIDRTYSLERIAEAHAYVDTERKTGAVVITVGKASEQR